MNESILNIFLHPRKIRARLKNLSEENSILARHIDNLNARITELRTKLSYFDGYEEELQQIAVLIEKAEDWKRQKDLHIRETHNLHLKEIQDLKEIYEKEINDLKLTHQKTLQQQRESSEKYTSTLKNEIRRLKSLINNKSQQVSLFDSNTATHPNIQASNTKKTGTEHEEDEDWLMPLPPELR